MRSRTKGGLAIGKYYLSRLLFNLVFLGAKITASYNPGPDNRIQLVGDARGCLGELCHRVLHRPAQQAGWGRLLLGIEPLLVAEYSKSRSFVLPSGTEDCVREGEDLLNKREAGSELYIFN